MANEEKYTDHALRIRARRDEGLARPPRTQAAKAADALNTAADVRKSFAIDADPIAKRQVRDYVARARAANQAAGATFWQQTIEAGRQQRQAGGQVQQEREEPTEKPRQPRQ